MAEVKSSSGGRVRSWFKRFIRAFYAGPRCYHRPGNRLMGYRSPNVIISIWAYTFVVLNTTLIGRITLALAVLFGMAGATTPLMPAYILAFAIIFLLAVNFVVAWGKRPKKIRVRRKFPEIVIPNKPFKVQYNIHNKGSKALWDLEVDILHHNCLHRPMGIQNIRYLSPGEKVFTEVEVVATRRCYVQLPEVVCATSFPFHFIRSFRIHKGFKELYAFPDFPKLDKMHVPIPVRGSGRGQQTGSLRNQGNVNFAGCREFQYGDSTRFIHARSWAKFQKPVVKEFVDELHAEVTLVVDCFFLKSMQSPFFYIPHPRLEAILKLTASIADYLLRNGINFNLVAAVIDQGKVTVHKKTAPTKVEVLKLLSRVQGLKDAHFDYVNEVFHKEIAESGSCIYIGPDLIEERQSFLSECNRTRNSLSVFEVYQNVPKELPQPENLTRHGVSIKKIETNTRISL
ncbi:MAG: DUF58 domain-containing protein [Lentisphaeria bacterium]|nr:DUF58 domain-containing protein [Lentisphaeria bacterium]